MGKVPDFGMHVVTINSGGREVQLSCRYVAPLTTFQDLMQIFDKAEAERQPGDEYSGNPAKWPNSRGVNAVLDHILKAVYEFEPPAHLISDQ